MSLTDIFTRLLAAIPKSDVDKTIPIVELDQTTFNNGLTMVFAVAGIVAVIFIVMGGYKYAISQGNPNDLENAKNRIVYALVGLGFVIFSFVIVQFVIANLFT